MMAKVNPAGGEFLTRKGKQTQQAIIDAVVALIRSKGFAETTVKDICAEAGVGVGTFYHYFQSKVEVLLSFIGEENDELLAFYAQTDKTSYGDAILAVMNRYLDLYFIKGPELVAQIYSTFLFSEIKLAGNLLENSLYKLLMDALEKGQQSGEFSDQISVEILCNTFIGTWFFFTSLWCNEAQTYDIRAVVNQHFPQLIRLVSAK